MRKKENLMNKKVGKTMRAKSKKNQRQLRNSQNQLWNKFKTVFKTTRIADRDLANLF